MCIRDSSRLVERAGTLRDVSQGVALGLRDVARGEYVAALRQMCIRDRNSSAAPSAEALTISPPVRTSKVRGSPSVSR